MSLRAAVIKTDLEEARKYAHEDPSEAFALDNDLSCYHYAAMFNSTTMLQYLLTLKSAKSATKVRNKRGDSILSTAASNRSLEVVRMLLALHGVNKSFMNSKNEWGETALHLAAASGKDIYELILESNLVDAGAMDQWNRLASDVARESWLGHAGNGSRNLMPSKLKNLSKMIEAPLNEEWFLKLLEEDDSIAFVSGKDMFGLSAAHKCAAWDKLNCLKALLKCAPRVRWDTDASGKTMLHLAAEMGAVKVLEFLVYEEGGLDDCRDESGNLAQDLCAIPFNWNLNKSLSSAQETSLDIEDSSDFDQIKSPNIEEETDWLCMSESSSSCGRFLCLRRRDEYEDADDSNHWGEVILIDRAYREMLWWAQYEEIDLMHPPVFESLGYRVGEWKMSARRRFYECSVAEKQDFDSKVFRGLDFEYPNNRSFRLYLPPLLPYTPSLHCRFPRPIRDQVILLLVMRNRPECIWCQVPRDIVFYIAARAFTW